MKYYIIILIIFLHIKGISQLSFNYYNTENGLPNNTIHATMQDSYGYMWIGTFGGLSKYDGYKFQNYTVFDSLSGISSGTIFAIYEDSNRDIWIGTNKELLFYNRKLDCFDKLPNIETACITNIAEDNNGFLWVSTLSGLFYIDKKEKKLIKKYGIEDGLPTIYLSCFVFDTHNNVWAGTHNDGFVKLNIKTDKFEIFNKYNSSYVLSNKVTSLCFDHNGKLYIGTVDEGLSIVDTAQNKTTYYKNLKKESVNLGIDFITQISIGVDSTIWICRNGYLNYFCNEKQDIIKYEPNQENEIFNSLKNISMITLDKYGDKWLGTYGNGILCVRKNDNNIRIFSSKSISLKEKNVTLENIRSFVRHGDSLLMGSDGNGIFVYDLNTSKITTLDIVSQYGLTNIMDFKLYKNELWCATWGEGIIIIDLKTKNARKLNIRDSNNNPLSINIFRYIAIYDGIAWLGSSGDGLLIYDIAKDWFLPNQISSTVDLRKIGWISSIFKDKKDRIWVLTFYGIYRFKDSKVEHILHDKRKKITLSDDVVYSGFTDSDDNIWIATNKGLNFYNIETDQFEKWGEITDIVTQPRSIIEDDNNTLWISTKEGIYRIRKETKHYKFFYKQKGIFDGDFIINSSIKTHKGEIFFGGKNGIVQFNPEAVRANSIFPRIVFRDLYVDYVRQNPQTSLVSKVSISSTDTLRFDYSYSTIGIEIADLNNFKYPYAIFSYMLEGISSDWIELDETRKINYSNIPPGIYTLRIKACYEKNQCSENDIIIEIVPPWWKTTWFKVFMILFFSIIIYLAYLLRINVIKQQNRLLKQKVEEKTNELQKYNKKLKQQNSKLMEDELLMQIKNDELEKLVITKDKLFSIIAHDLKNPLTSIIGFAELLHEDKTIIEKQKNKIDIIFNSSKNILTQLNNLLNWARTQSQSIKCNPQNICVQSLINDNITLLNDAVLKKKIVLQYIPDHYFDAFADVEMINIVIRNILSNAIKFTPEKGSITISTSNTQEYTIVTIEDSGIGMSQEMIGNLFSSSVNDTRPGTNEEKGTGLGLIVCKEFLNINNSKIEIISEENKGSVFKIYLPKGAIKKTENLSQELLLKTEIEKKQENDYETSDIKPLILIIDDNIEILNYIVNIFSPFYIIETATDGEEGYNKALETIPNLIITDLMMPKKNGIEMCDKIKTTPILNHIPIIILSARNEIEIQLKSIEAGAFDFIPKPFNKQMLFLKVQSLLKTREKFKDYLRKELVQENSDTKDKYIEDEFMTSINLVLEKFYADSNFGVEKFATEMNYSRSQLFRKLKATIDISPVEYLKIFRLKKAKELLLNSNKRVSEIAYDVGFNDPQYFSICFKSHYGTSPNQFAKNNP